MKKLSLKSLNFTSGDLLDRKELKNVLGGYGGGSGGGWGYWKCCNMNGCSGCVNTNQSCTEGFTVACAMMV